MKEKISQLYYQLISGANRFHERRLFRRAGRERKLRKKLRAAIYRISDKLAEKSLRERLSEIRLFRKAPEELDDITQPAYSVKVPYRSIYLSDITSHLRK